jgi:hypothetical protein
MRIQPKTRRRETGKQKEGQRERGYCDHHHFSSREGENACKKITSRHSFPAPSSLFSVFGSKCHDVPWHREWSHEFVMQESRSEICMHEWNGV